METMDTYCFRPAKLLEIKLSFVPKEKNEVLLAVPLMLDGYWMEAKMTSPAINLNI
jgi:hypothetical protein